MPPLEVIINTVYVQYGLFYFGLEDKGITTMNIYENS